MSTKTNWANIGDSCFMPTGETTDKLPPGLYNPHVTMGGNIIFAAKTVKTDKLHLLPRSTSEDVMNELTDFWGKKALFDKYELLYKRGILMYGPPGTGKTSLINMIVAKATELGVISLIGRRLDAVQTAAQKLRELQPESRLMVIIEDVDQWGNHSSLTDLLDGAEQVDNVVYLATTNYLNQVPARIKNRPSRFDTVIEVGHPEAEARMAFFKNLSKDPDDNFTEWVEKTEGLSFAHLKELFIAMKVLGRDLDVTIERLRGMESLCEDNSDDDDYDDYD